MADVNAGIQIYRSNMAALRTLETTFQDNVSRMPAEESSRIQWEIAYYHQRLEAARKKLLASGADEDSLGLWPFLIIAGLALAGGAYVYSKWSDADQAEMLTQQMKIKATTERAALYGPEYAARLAEAEKPAGITIFQAGSAGAMGGISLSVVALIGFGVWMLFKKG